jgi:S1-C subfamily serine protease
MLNAIAMLKPGSTSKFTFIRDGRETELPITVGQRPKPGARSGK